MPPGAVCGRAVSAVVPMTTGPAADRVESLRERLAAARWPPPPGVGGWALGTDLEQARRVCEHWGGG